MIEGPIGWKLLNAFASACFLFQPLVLSKLLALLLYYHALHCGIRTWQMARKVNTTRRASNPLD